MVIVVFGVCGSGKTTIGRLLAAALKCPCLDADDFHSKANKEKMNSGIPLTDEDRKPWLDSLRTEIEGWVAKGSSAVLACSALKSSYREHLAVDPDRVRFVLLDGSAELIAGRLADRQGHYMNPGLLESQFAALEETGDYLRVDIAPPPEEIVQSILDRLNPA